MFRNEFCITGLFLLLTLTSYPISIVTSFSPPAKTQSFRMITNTWIESEYNQYRPNGNVSVLVALDSNLFGGNKTYARLLFDRWLVPFETKFGLSFHIQNITTFTPSADDDLWTSMDKVTQQLSWTRAVGVNDSRVQGNGYDWLFIYQENYQGGQNHANALFGNAFIIAHKQPVFDRQLIFLHELGHLYGGEHDSDGNVSLSWYGEEEYSIMDYDDLKTLDDLGWDSLPVDEHNFAIMNATRYRFDLNDAELDGLPNYYEYRYNLNPTLNDSHSDSDNDGLTNLEEFQFGTNPLIGDTDQDGLSDWAERYVGTSPINSSEVPSVDIPIIIPWTNQSKFNTKNQINVKWRAISSNPNYFEVYQNHSLVLNDSWTTELIQYQPTKLAPGIWNFTCLVVDMEGDNATAEVWLEVISEKNTPLIILSPLLGIGFLTILHRKKVVKLKRNV